MKTTETDSQPHPHRNHRDLLTLVSTAVVIAILTTYIINTASPRYAENLPAALTPLNLPDGAQQVSYCKGYRGIIAYEFTIDETGFKDWVSSGIGSLESQSAGVSLESISGGYSMTRYNSLCEELTGPDTAYINDGLYYEWTKEDRGVYAAFDRATNRAYFYFHSY